VCGEINVYLRNVGYGSGWMCGTRKAEGNARRRKETGAKGSPASQWHSLTDVDEAIGTATCLQCGPVQDLYRHTTGRWLCKESLRQRSRQKKYGVAPAEYQGLLDKQDGVCAICLRSPNTLSRPLAVDHDHSTGLVRGLLCSNCNTLLGLADDNPNVLERAWLYLATCPNSPWASLSRPSDTVPTSTAIR